METEGIYRRLAAAVAQDEKFFAECKNIRDAIKHRAKYEEDKDGNLVAKPVLAGGSGNRRQTRSTATTQQPPDADTPSSDPAEVLQNVDADEIIDNIADDVEKLEEVAARSIAKLTPDKVCDALTKAWTADQLKDLRSKLNTYINALPLQDAPARRMEMPGFERRV
jgi:hypothetical protein